MKIKFETLEDIKKAIENNDRALENKSAFDLEIELDKEFSDEDMAKLYNELYADDNIKLILAKSEYGFLPKFEVKLFNKKFYITPAFIDNCVGLVYVLEMQNHFEALKRLIKIANSIKDSDKVQMRNYSLCFQAFIDEERKIMKGSYSRNSAEKLEIMYYLDEIANITSEEKINHEKFMNWFNAEK